MSGNEFDAIDELLSGEYISMQPGEKKILKFYGPQEKKIENVEKKWNNEPIWKIRFIVTEPKSATPKMDKFLDVGKCSARLIVPKLKEGHRLLEIQRMGSGKETLYVPTPITASAAA